MPDIIELTIVQVDTDLRSVTLRSERALFTLMLDTRTLVFFDPNVAFGDFDPTETLNIDACATEHFRVCSDEHLATCIAAAIFIDYKERASRAYDEVAALREVSTISVPH